MGYIGRYLDSLPDYVADRVLRAQDWNDGSLFATNDGCKCLAGHAENWVVVMGHHEFAIDQKEYHRRKTYFHNVAFSRGRLSRDQVRGYPDLVNRFGKEIAVRLIKQRIGKRFELQITTTKAEAAERQDSSHALQETAAV